MTWKTYLRNWKSCVRRSFKITLKNFFFFLPLLGYINYASGNQKLWPPGSQRSNVTHWCWKLTSSSDAMEIKIFNPCSKKKKEKKKLNLWILKHTKEENSKKFPPVTWWRKLKFSIWRLAEAVKVAAKKKKKKISQELLAEAALHCKHPTVYPCGSAEQHSVVWSFLITLIRQCWCVMISP